MSLILEALKKSERERLGNAASVPLITRPHHVLGSRNMRRRRQSRVAMAMVVLLVVTALTAWFLTEGQDMPDQARQTLREPLPQIRVVEPPPVSSPLAVQPPQMESKIDHPQESVETPMPVAVETLPQQELTTESLSGTVIDPTIEPVADPVVDEVEPPELAVHAEQEPKEAEVNPAANSELRTFRQLPSSLRNSLKPMHLDVLVYYRRENRRFVYVSGRLYTEGARLKNGVELIEIVPSGVVMRINGEQFLLTVND